MKLFEKELRRSAAEGPADANAPALGDYQDAEGVQEGTGPEKTEEVHG
jgi:hypothetical protein